MAKSSPVILVLLHFEAFTASNRVIGLIVKSNTKKTLIPITGRLSTNSEQHPGR